MEKEDVGYDNRGEDSFNRDEGECSFNGANGDDDIEPIEEMMMMRTKLMMVKCWKRKLEWSKMKLYLLMKNSMTIPRILLRIRIVRMMAKTTILGAKKEVGYSISTCL